jgi:dihydrofolate reductase
MRKLIVNTFISLDGVMQAPGGPDEDPSAGFALGGWAVTYFDEEMMERMAAADPYELLLGRGTYEIFAAHWPHADGPIADRLNSTRKRFFGDATIPAGLKLVDSQISKTGVTINTYERAGEVSPGSFEFDEPTEAEMQRRERLAASCQGD